MKYMEGKIKDSNELREAELHDNLQIKKANAAKPIKVQAVGTWLFKTGLIPLDPLMLKSAPYRNLSGTLDYVK